MIKQEVEADVAVVASASAVLEEDCSTILTVESNDIFEVKESDISGLGLLPLDVFKAVKQ